MRNILRDVRDFHKKFGLITKDSPVHLTRRKLYERVECLQEELGEFNEACQQQDFEKQVDALIDIIYFALGTLVMLVIQGLNAAGVVAAGTAGKWSAYLSTGLVAVAMIIKALGAEADMASVSEWATVLSGAVVTAVVAIASAKGTYEGAKRTGLIDDAKG